MLDEKEIASKTRAIDPATCEREYDGAEVEFMQALEKYKMTSEFVKRLRIFNDKSRLTDPRLWPFI